METAEALTRWPIVIDGDEQALFNKVVTHLRQQGHRAMRHYNDMLCTYRDATQGTQCAIGCLLPEDLTTDEVDKLDAAGGVEKCINSGLLRFPDVERGFLIRLQNLHDLQTKDIGYQAEYTAQMYGLGFAVVYDSSLPAWPETWR